MLKKVLPMVGNHQLLAQALANTKFLIDYEAPAHVLNAGVISGKKGRQSNIVALSGYYTFYDESILLSFLKNEFASVNMITANGCIIGVYNNTLNYGSPFLFYKKENQLLLNTEPTSTLASHKQNQVVQTTIKNLKDFMAAGAKLMAMSKGKETRSDRYKQLEILLKDFIPIPFTEKIELNSPDMFITAKNKRPDDVFDVYIRNLPDSDYQATMYIVRGSGKKIGNSIQFTAYEDDPRTIYGKLIGLRRQLIGEWNMVFIEKPGEAEEGSIRYAGRPLLEKYYEWFSFLEELPHPLLKFLFPAYCDYITEYTKLDQDNRNYCAP